MINVGDLVTPKKHPVLKDKVRKIAKDFNGNPLYILENGCMYTAKELE